MKLATILNFLRFNYKQYCNKKFTTNITNFVITTIIKNQYCPSNEQRNIIQQTIPNKKLHRNYHNLDKTLFLNWLKQLKLAVDPIHSFLSLHIYITLHIASDIDTSYYLSEILALCTSFHLFLSFILEKRRRQKYYNLNIE